MNLYTTHCPNCQMVSTILIQKGIPFATVDQKSVVEEVALKHRLGVPILETDDKQFLGGTELFKYLHTLGGKNVR